MMVPVAPVDQAFSAPRTTARMLRLSWRAVPRVTLLAAGLLAASVLVAGPRASDADQPNIAVADEKNGEDEKAEVTPPVLKVLKADGSSARLFRGVVQAHVGYREPLPKTWWSARRQDGLVTLAGLAAGTHWLVMAPDSWNRTPFQLEFPLAEPSIQRRLRLDHTWRSNNLFLKASVHAGEQGGDVIRVRIENNTDEALRISEQDVMLEAGRMLSQSGVLSPAWLQNAAAFPETTIEPGRTGQINLRWQEWVRRGLWFDYGGLGERAGPVLPDPEPGKISVRVWIRTHGVLPVSVMHPSLMNLAAAANGEPRIAPHFGGEQSERQREASKSPIGRAMKELEGTWRFVAAESLEEGWDQPRCDQPLDVVRTWVWWIRDSRANPTYEKGFQDEDHPQVAVELFAHGPGPVPGFTDATLRIYPEQSPKAIELSYHDGTSLKGIYKVQNGQLIVCVRSHAEAARGRPTEFMFDGDTGLSQLILKKVEGR